MLLHVEQHIFLVNLRRLLLRKQLTNLSEKKFYFHRSSCKYKANNLYDRLSSRIILKPHLAKPTIFYREKIHLRTLIFYEVAQILTKKKEQEVETK